MQAMTRDMAMTAGYFAPRPVPINLRLARWHLPPAWRPVLVKALRVAMGTSVGAVLGAAAGHGAFWPLVGTVLGLALDAIARRNCAPVNHMGV